MPQIVRIFVGGGGDDWISHIVENYEAAYRGANPGYLVRYFSWTEGRAIREMIGAQPRDAAIGVIGHSYGGDTAFSSIDERVVDLLISIDPVARSKTSWTAVRARARLWLNVRAEPSADRRTKDDTIAWIGGKYGRPPAAGQPGAPNHSIIANQTHGRFSDMMRTIGDGVSGQSLLGGNSVG